MVTVARPGTTVERRALRAVPGFPTDTGKAFLVGFTEKGPVTPVEVFSPDEYADVFGGDAGVYATMAHSVEAFFGEGGASAVICRVTGPDPVLASVTLDDGSAVDTLTFEAASFGTWANGAAGGLDVVVAAGTTSGKKVTVTLDDEAVETADNLTTIAAIVAAFATSAYVTVIDEASVSGDPLPANGTFALTAGTDDNGAATDADWAAALETFTYVMGPGQVMAPGRVTTAAHTQLLEHAAAHNRTALLDPPFEATKLQLTNLAAALDDLVDAPRGGGWRRWLRLPDAVAGVTRYVPPSAAVAGRIARSDAETNPGEQVIAENGRFQHVIAAAGPEFTDDDRTDVHAAGWNEVLDDPLGLRIYGFRSVTSDDRWQDLSHNRIFMELEARVKAQDEFVVGKKINAKTIGDYNSAGRAECFRLYDRGSLYGDSAAEAFRVVTDPPVNTPATAAAREINREIYLRVAESVELSRTIVTKVPVTSTV
jgi:phage tail sheath protein FI